MFKKFGLGCLGLIAIFVVIGIIGAALGTSKTASSGHHQGNPPPAATTAAPKAAPTTAPTAAPQQRTVLDHSGSGMWTSPTFTVRNDWRIVYRYNCASFGSPGNFIVDVYGPGNTGSTSGVNEEKMSGSGSTYVHDVSGKGSYIDVNSECDWHVRVIG